MMVNITEDFTKYSGKAGIHNVGFYGMNFKKGNYYKLSFYVRSNGYNGRIKFQLSDINGQKVSDQVFFFVFERNWTKFSATLKSYKILNGVCYQLYPKSRKIPIDMGSLFPSDTWDKGNLFLGKIL
jgi:hypothetical protein